MTSQEQQQRNKLFLSHMDQALGHSGIPQAELQQMMRQASKALECNATCQKNKEIEKLKTAWITSQSQEKTLQTEIQEKKKKYFLAAKGPEFYKKTILRPQFQTEINEFIKKQQKQLNNTMTSNTQILNSYHATTTSMERIKQLYKDVLAKKTKLKQDIDSKVKTTNTSERRVYYEFQEMDQLQYYNTIIKYVYFTIITLYTILSLYYFTGQYKNLMFWVFIIIAVILPFILSYLIRFVYDKIWS
jgi:hypothetical protein